MRSLVFLLALLPMLCCAPKPLAESPAQQRAALVERLELETVAMVHWVMNGELAPVNAPGSTKSAYCAGVWVSRTDFVTAAHCPEGEVYLMVQTRDDEATDTWRAAKLVSIRPLQDLALVRLNGTPPPHPVVTFARRVPRPGDPLHFVGHVVGQTWTYGHAFVSAFRAQRPDADGDPVDTLQVSGPIWNGDSGGGAFDEDGGLVGIMSYVSHEAPLIGYLIYRDVVRELVGAK